MNIHKLLARAYRQIGDTQLANLHEELATEVNTMSSVGQGDDNPTSDADARPVPIHSRD